MLDEGGVQFIVNKHGWTIIAAFAICVTCPARAFEFDALKWGMSVDGPNRPRQTEWQCTARLQESLLAMAAAARISGDVAIEATIASDATIIELRVVRGHPLLVPAALEYAKHCRHTPFTEPKQPTRTVQTVNLSFRYLKILAVPLAPIPLPVGRASP